MLATWPMGIKSDFLFSVLCFLLTALYSCSPRAVVQERVVTVHDTIRVEVPVNVHATYPDGWIGSTQRALDSLCAMPLLNESQVGLCVLDLTDGVQVYEHGARQRMRPASTMKVVTAVTAMNAVLDHPDAFTLRCKVVRDVHDGKVATLQLAGGMDPLLEYTDLCSLADMVAKAGVATVRDIQMDVSLSDTTRWGEGWCWDDENEAMTPFLYKGANSPRGGKGSSLLSWKQMPEVPFVTDLRKALSSRKIKITGQVYRARVDMGKGEDVMRVGHAWDDVLGPMMKNSNNQFAESMLWQLGIVSSQPNPNIEQVTAPFRSLCMQLGLSTSQYRIADGSGRSLYNYVTSELLCRLLNFAATQPWFGRFRQSLPVMGVDGTLKKRCHGTSACNNVQAKTGTVTGVVSLAGYAVSSEGHLLCFAIINQGVSSGVLGRNFQDEVCKVLTR